MTTPTVIVTLDGGVIQGICSTRQVSVIVLDRDTEGADKEDLTMVDGSPSWVSTSWDLICPNEDTDVWIAQVLADIERDQRP